ncbi:hypothetical protein ACW9HF_15220 [Nocardia gipuzkoensis]
MTFPPGAPYDGTAYGISASGAIPGMSGRTQDAITEQLKSTVGDGRWGQIEGGILSIIAAAIAAILGGFGTVIDAIFGTVNNDFVADLPIINDHSQSITVLQAQIEQMILQGLAIKFVSNGTYYPNPELLSVEIIVIGAGAGGASGRWDIIPDNRRGGGGGGGGGEVHLSIPASLLPVDGSGNFLPIPITIGAGGAGGTGSPSPGVGGGNTSFGSYVLGGGGQGGTGGGVNVNGVGGQGGAGMIPGGNGGNGGGFTGAGTTQVPPTTGTHSTSFYDLHGGGGGGGGGGGIGNSSGAIPGAGGGIGGASAGGASNGAAGTAPSAIVATGGGGGAGSNAESGVTGGAGAFPAGGGGGGGGGSGPGNNGIGGQGGNGILFVIERLS